MTHVLATTRLIAMDYLATLVVTVPRPLLGIFTIDMIGGFPQVTGMHPHIFRPPTPDLGLPPGLHQEAAMSLIDHLVTIQRQSNSVDDLPRLAMLVTILVQVAPIRQHKNIAVVLEALLLDMTLLVIRVVQVEVSLAMATLELVGLQLPPPHPAQVVETT